MSSGIVSANARGKESHTRVNHGCELCFFTAVAHVVCHPRYGEILTKNRPASDAAGKEFSETADDLIMVATAVIAVGEQP